MSETTLEPANKPRPGRLAIKTWMIIPLAFVLLLAAAWAVWASRGPQPAAVAGEFPANAEIEERFGVRFTFLAVTGRNGLVDLRYRVTDAGKAKNFGHYTETSPLIINEKTGNMIETTKMGLHNHRVEPGRIYYVMYRNTGEILQSGDLVTIQVGDLKLEHVQVQ